MDGGGDILMAKARELVTKKGIGESAGVTRKLQAQQQEVFEVRMAVDPKSEPASLVDVVPEVVVRRGSSTGQDPV